MADTPNRNEKRKNKKTVLASVRELMKSQAPKGEYIEAIGRRKTANARVRLYPAKTNSMVVNGLDRKSVV